MEINFSTILDYIAGLGAAGGPIFAILWWLERIERKDCQAVTKEMLVQQLTITNQATNSIAAVTAIVTEIRTATREADNHLAQLITATHAKQR